MPDETDIAVPSVLLPRKEPCISVILHSSAGLRVRSRSHPGLESSSLPTVQKASQQHASARVCEGTTIEVCVEAHRHFQRYSESQT
ncbi:hypothetical protein NDU88_002431 [Pleurodeles waltl]|uniref:Uncharacterized protein n=1 Tax=Pleurodeles waltl TaxID=8319 RepID=A0AAV7Q6W3_PLEWA|nr:hypothetical protein NDU88_002431 [Pleurodeles waltl]